MSINNIPAIGIFGKKFTPTFTFSGSDGTGGGVASCMCKMDGSAYSGCISPFTSPALADGLLIRQGFLYREHGRGTFVSPQKLQKGISELTSFTEDMKQRGLLPGQKILEIGYIDPPDQVRAHLELPSNCKQVLRIERLRLGDDVPMGLQTSYYLLPEGQTITRAELEEYGSIYKMLQEIFHLIPTEADETLEVTLATPREASLLQIPPGSPLLLSERTTYSQYRRVIEFVKILYRGDRYRYLAKLTR